MCNLFDGTCLLLLYVAFHWCVIQSTAAVGVSQCCITLASGFVLRKPTEGQVHAITIIHWHPVNDQECFLLCHQGGNCESKGRHVHCSSRDWLTWNVIWYTSYYCWKQCQCWYPPAHDSTFSHQWNTKHPCIQPFMGSQPMPTQATFMGWAWK